MKERFEQYVMPIPWSGCHIWIGTSLPKGYGQFRIHKDIPMRLAHRVAYELYKGEIPEGMCVCHTCDVTCCVNPEHLFLGTNQDNADDKVSKGRQLSGEAHPRVKLTLEQVEAIRRDIRTQRLIAEEYGVSQSNISLIKLGINWESKNY